MSQVDLLTPIYDDGIRNINFFNGRLLTAQDLEDEQEAHRLKRRLLGQAIGAGIIQGLEVEPDPSGDENTVLVSPGTALNLKGQVLAVASADGVTVQLVPEEAELTQQTGLFAPCTRPVEGTVLTGTGFYVLAMSPASGFEETIPQHTLSDNGTATGCGYRYAVDGVQFRLVSLNPGSVSAAGNPLPDEIVELQDDPSTADLNKIRNTLAHLCLGTWDVAQFALDPFALANDKSAFVSYGALQELYAVSDGLDECEVPLAVIYWTEDGLQFVDMWSVRRRPTVEPSSNQWPLLSGQRQPVEGEVGFLQFQQQLAMLSDQANVKASEHFRYLPAAGILPVTAGFNLDKIDLPAQGPDGFNADTFFDEFQNIYRGIIVGAELNALIRTSFTYAPIDIKDRAQQSVRLYFVAENMGRGQNDDDSGAAQLYLVYTAGYLPNSTPTWDEHLLVAKETRSVAEIRGIGPKRSATLGDAGYGELTNLARAEPAQIAQILKVTQVSAEDFIADAQRLLTQEASDLAKSGLPIKR